MTTNLIEQAADKLMHGLLSRQVNRHEVVEALAAALEQRGEVVSSEIHMLEPTTPAQASDAEDAARYQHIRKYSRSDLFEQGIYFDWYEPSPEKLDAAIDAARKGEQS